jgi:hypothetical protein
VIVLKGYPVEVLLPKDAPIQGVVLSDRIKCLDPAGGAGAGSIGQAEHAVEIKRVEMRRRIAEGCNK